MALPLPNVIPNVGPGGPLVTAMGGMNALQKAMLENKYYAPNIQSEINNRNALTQGQNITNQYLPDKLRLANAMAQLENQYYAPNIQSEINSRNALTNKTNTMLPYERKELELKNQYYPQLTEAQIYNYKMGGKGGMSTGAKDDLLFQQSLGMDNPSFSQEDQRTAANIVADGGATMPDGRPIVFSPASQRAYDRSVRSTTTANIVTGGVKANQAEAELKVLNDYAQEGLKPYGNTILNKSPQQIVDSFKTDDESQTKLGRLIGAQAIGYEAAQNRIRLANGQPGVSSTEELMKLSGQQIEMKFPMLSYTARKEAARYMDEALEKGLNARKSVGIGASSIVNKKNTGSEKKATLRYNQNIGDFEEIK